MAFQCSCSDWGPLQHGHRSASAETSEPAVAFDVMDFYLLPPVESEPERFSRSAVDAVSPDRLCPLLNPLLAARSMRHHKCPQLVVIISY